MVNLQDSFLQSNWFSSNCHSSYVLLPIFPKSKNNKPTQFKELSKTNKKIQKT
jgi:hypothetical protein